MEAHERKLYVCGLVREVDEETLKQHFTKYGPVSRTIVARDRITNNPKGHGFVWFCDASSARQALEDNSEHVILGKTVQVKWPIHRIAPHQNHQQDHSPSRQVMCGNVGDNGSFDMQQFRTKKIFVGGLPAGLTHEEFKDFFERFGGTTDVVIMFDNVTRRPRGFGFVTFESENSVEDVMQNNYYTLNGRNVEVKRAVPKSASSCLNWQSGQPWPSDYDPSYPTAYGAFPGYSYFPRYYWPPPYHVISGPPSYGAFPLYTNGLLGNPSGAAAAALMFDPFAMKGNNLTTNYVVRNGTFSATEDPKLDNDSLRIAELKLDADSEDHKGGRGNGSS